MIDDVPIDETAGFPSVAAIVQPGRAVRYNGQLHHIRAIVDGWQVVYCEWWPRHRRWTYKIVPILVYQMGLQDGAVTPAGKSRFRGHD